MNFSRNGEKPHDLGVHSRAEKASLSLGALSAPGEALLQKLFSTFPEGWPGLGLVLMRLAVGLSAIVQGIGTFIDSPAQMLSCTIGSLEIIAGAALLIGFLTPIAGASASLGNLAIAVSWFRTSGENAHVKTVAALYLVVISIAVTLLGPGAFSLDARLFGRREIIIPEASRPPLHDVRKLQDKEKA
jgi:uncharacterized membrane protein YphA (DoxX/SURF4 family)